MPYSVLHSGCTIYSPTNSAQGFQLLHTLANTCYFLFVFVCLFVYFNSSYPSGYKVKVIFYTEII